MGFIQGLLVERMHLKFCKQLLGVKQTTQNDFIYGELGRYPLIVHRQYRIIKFGLKQTNGDMVLFPNKNNWAIRVKYLLEMC